MKVYHQQKNKISFKSLKLQADPLKFKVHYQQVHQALFKAHCQTLTLRYQLVQHSVESTFYHQKLSKKLFKMMNNQHQHLQAQE